MYVLRIVSMDKILCFINILIIINYEHTYLRDRRSTRSQCRSAGDDRNMPLCNPPELEGATSTCYEWWGQAKTTTEKKEKIPR